MGAPSAVGGGGSATTSAAWNRAAGQGFRAPPAHGDALEVADSLESLDDGAEYGARLVVASSFGEFVRRLGGAVEVTRGDESHAVLEQFVRSRPLRFTVHPTHPTPAYSGR